MMLKNSDENLNQKIPIENELLKVINFNSILF